MVFLRCSLREELNLKNLRLPRLVIGPGEKKTLSGDEEQEIYAGMCWYEFERKRLERRDLRILSGLLAGGRDVEHFRTFSTFVTEFINGADDRFTVEVRRAATLNKESLLRRVDAVW